MSTLKEILVRWTSRKVIGAMIVTASLLYNSWGVAGRPLNLQEIIMIGSVWGVFIGTEGIADAIERGKDTPQEE